MAYLFAAAPPSYAEEQLNFHLGALSTIPIALAPSLSSAKSDAAPSPHLQAALHELSSSKPITRDRLVSILTDLAHPSRISTSAVGHASSELDQVVEVEILTRAVTVVWKEVMQVFVDSALALDEERSWWDGAVASRRSIAIYLLQTLPLRLYRAVQPASRTFTIPSLQSLHFPARAALFRPLSTTASSALTSMTSPFVLTRHEMMASRRALTHARDTAAHRVGVLASQGPRWADSASQGQAQAAGLASEATRLYSVIAHVLEIPPPPSPSSKRSRSATITPPHASAVGSATPAALLAVLEVHLPRAQQPTREALRLHHRPTALTRLWFPLLLVPPAFYLSASAIVRNRAWMRQQIADARDTIRGFFVSWVWEPIEDIAKTLRQGGEGLGVAPTTVQSDQARMVLDLGRDYYHLDGPALEQLSQKVRAGDMEEVLRVYEKELQSPVKNALMGSLIRTLLIQVQKTKTDLSLSLLSLDHLLRSQQLTFAFVGVAPSFLVLYAAGGWLRGLWRGEKRGRGRMRRYFATLREVERLLLTSPADGGVVTERDRGLLIVSITGLRSWAAGLGRNRDAFLDDLRMVENPSLDRGDKLGVVNRIWRCWGIDGRGGPK